MPNLAAIVKRRFLHQTLVYWARTGSDPYGKPAFAAPPVEVACRWEDREVEIIMPAGRKVIAHSYVLLITPLLVGSVVFLGTLAGWRALANPQTPPTVLQGGREVVKTNATPDVNNQSVIYESWLT